MISINISVLRQHVGRKKRTAKHFVCDKCDFSRYSLNITVFWSLLKDLLKGRWSLRETFFKHVISCHACHTKFYCLLSSPVLLHKFTIDKIHISSKMQTKQKMNDFACFPSAQDRKPLMIHLFWYSSKTLFQISIRPVTSLVFLLIGHEWRSFGILFFIWWQAEQKIDH